MRGMRDQNGNEPLELSAPLAWRLAPTLCHKDPATGEDCAWSHGFWQYLRLLGLAGDPGNHADFFREAFAEAGRGGAALRVLVCGTADYAMLAALMSVYGKRDPAPEITVIDRCETPLWLNRWYAERMQLHIETLCCDVLDYAPERPFDLICTHSFFSYFPPESRPRLLAKWRQLLQPGGSLVTANRVRGGDATAPAAFSMAQAAAFRDKVLRLARDGRGLPGITEVELARSADTYARTVTAWPVRSFEEIRNLFEGTGFRLDRLTGASVSASGGDQAAAAGPTAPAGTEYAHIVAMRL